MHISPGWNRHCCVYSSVHKGAARFPNRELGVKEKLHRELMLCWEQPRTCSAGWGIRVGRGPSTPGRPPCPAVRCPEAAVRGPRCPGSPVGMVGAPSLQGEGECMSTRGARLPAGTEVVPGAMGPPLLTVLLPLPRPKAGRDEAAERSWAGGCGEGGTRAHTQPGWLWSSPPPRHGLLQPLGSLAALPTVEITNVRQWQRQVLHAQEHPPHVCSLTALCRDSASSLPPQRPACSSETSALWHGSPMERRPWAREPCWGWPLGSPSSILSAAPTSEDSSPFACSSLAVSPLHGQCSQLCHASSTVPRSLGVLAAAVQESG